MNADLTSKAILVTGTSTGIGLATVLMLDDLGYRVFASVRKEADAEKLRAETSDHTHPLIMDVADSGSIHKAKQELQDRLDERGLAGLVNNAAIGIGGPLEFIPLDELRFMYDVNLFGLLEVTQAFLPLLRKAKGRIVNISSTASLYALPTHGPYSSGKSALNSMSEALRLELMPHGVDVSVIICGSIKTPIWQKGRKLSGDIVRQMPPEAKQLYGSMSFTVGNYFSEMGKAGAPPETAARVIVKALTEKNPKNTYLVGRDAVLFNLVIKFVHGKLRDRLIMRTMGLET